MTRRKIRVIPNGQHLRTSYLDAREISEASRVLARIWNASKSVLAKDRIEMPAIALVLDNADSLERAAHVGLGKGLTLICRSRLLDSDDLSKGLVAELVVWEKTGTICGISKVAVTYELKTERWVFFVNSGPGRSKKITALLERLGIDNPLARVSTDVEEHIAVGLMSAIVKWTAEHIKEHRQR